MLLEELRTPETAHQEPEKELFQQENTAVSALGRLKLCPGLMLVFELLASSSLRAKRSSRDAVWEMLLRSLRRFH